MNEAQKLMKMMIDALTAFKQEVLGGVNKRFDKTDKEIGGLKKQIGDVELNLSTRIDNLGRQLAVLDDDAPSGEEFVDLKRRVTKIEQSIAVG